MNRSANPNWWDRNWKWFIPAVCVLILVVVCSFIGLVFYGISSMMKSSDPYRVAVEQARKNPDVVEAIGEPIKEGFFISGNITTSGASGTADLAIPISGPKGDATIYLSANKSVGKWNYQNVIIEIEKTEDRIDLLPK